MTQALVKKRAQRIIQSAVQLAEQGGFDAVRLRDVAADADVALGTLYSHFRSKEALLVAALEAEVARFETLMEQCPPMGETPLERATTFFGLASRALFMRPHFARAVLRSVASGEPAVAEKVLRFHQRMGWLIVATLRGCPLTDEDRAALAGTREEEVGSLLQQVWFATLVGWMGGMHDGDTQIRKMASATEIILAGLSSVEPA
jgi:AcrR family transcriptional regulator